MKRWAIALLQLMSLLFIWTFAVLLLIPPDHDQLLNVVGIGGMLIIGAFVLAYYNHTRGGE